MTPAPSAFLSRCVFLATLAQISYGAQARAFDGHCSPGTSTPGKNLHIPVFPTFAKNTGSDVSRAAIALRGPRSTQVHSLSS
jgi:hypothetical protein